MTKKRKHTSKQLAVKRQREHERKREEQVASALNWLLGYPQWLRGPLP